MPNPLEALQAFIHQRAQQNFGDTSNMEVMHGSAPLPLDALGALKGLAAKFGIGGGEAAANVAPGALGAAGTSAGDMFHPGAQQMMESMHKAANPVFEGLRKAGTFAGDRGVSGMASAAGHVGDLPLGQTLAEFVPVGEEAVFNAGKAVPSLAKSALNPAELGFQRIMANRGR